MVAQREDTTRPCPLLKKCVLLSTTMGHRIRPPSPPPRATVRDPQRTGDCVLRLQRWPQRHHVQNCRIASLVRKSREEIASSNLVLRRLQYTVVVKNIEGEDLKDHLYLSQP